MPAFLCRHFVHNKPIDGNPVAYANSPPEGLRRYLRATFTYSYFSQIHSRTTKLILGGDDAWKITGLLKEKNVPVILTGTLDLPSREDDSYDTLYENAAKLQQAGVIFCISTGDNGAHVRIPLISRHTELNDAFKNSK